MDKDFKELHVFAFVIPVFKLLFEKISHTQYRLWTHVDLDTTVFTSERFFFTTYIQYNQVGEQHVYLSFIY